MIYAQKKIKLKDFYKCQVGISSLACFIISLFHKTNMLPKGAHPAAFAHNADCNCVISSPADPL